MYGVGVGKMYLLLHRRSYPRFPFREEVVTHSRGSRSSPVPDRRDRKGPSRSSHWRVFVPGTGPRTLSAVGSCPFRLCYKGRPMLSWRRRGGRGVYRRPDSSVSPPSTDLVVITVGSDRTTVQPRPRPDPEESGRSQFRSRGRRSGVPSL